MTDVAGQPGQDRHAEPIVVTWSGWRDLPHVVLHRPHLRKTLRIALLVGTILFVINQLDVVASGKATPFVWFKVALTYVVPFCVSNWGILIATRRRHPQPREGVGI